jgi:anhydro-N-acetylmuramic acid kinase
VAAIGAHGQTVRHRPAVRRHGLHLQLNNPALLAERTGITVGRLAQPRCGRRRPGRALVPAFHPRVRPGRETAVLNSAASPISRVRPAAAEAPVLGFDCGPAMR